MSQSQLHRSIDQYQNAAKGLQNELVKAFDKLSKKADIKPWKPLNSLELENIPRLDDVLRELHENIEKLGQFDHKEKTKGLVWDKAKRGINKFVEWTLPALTNFMVATKDAQSVSTLSI